MAISNSIELPSNLPFAGSLIAANSGAQHENKSCCIAELSAQELLFLNGLDVEIQVFYPGGDSFTELGHVVSVLIPSTALSLKGLLFLPRGSSEPDFLDANKTRILRVFN